MQLSVHFVMIVRAIRGVSWVTMMLLAGILFAMTARYFSFRSDINFLNAKQDVVHDLVWRSAFYTHITGGMFALVIGPLQLLRKSRTRFRKWHRTLGKIYVTAILLIGAPAGFYMAIYANGGPWASTGFAVMSMLWFYTTFTAYQFARERKFKDHSKWMVRSYALTFSAVTLRLWVPFCSMALQMNPHTVIVLSAWTSWGINLIFVELYLALNQKPKLRVAH